jgi:Serine aminopeptidase, S33
MTLASNLKNQLANFARLSTNEEYYTSYQRMFKDKLTILHNMLKNTQVKNSSSSAGRQALSEDKISLYVLLDEYDTLHRSSLFLYTGMQFLSVRPNECQQVLSCIEGLRKSCEKIVDPQGVYNKMRVFLFDTSIGTLDQLRVELEMAFCTKRILIPVEPDITIDLMVFLPTIPEETARAKDIRLRTLEQQLEEKDGNISRDHSLKASNSASSLGLKANDSALHPELVNIVLLCQPNGNPYEMLFNKKGLLNSFLSINYHAVVWNYRGFGRSKGSPTMENMISDCKALINFLKKKFQVRRFVIYGRSIGGHIAKILSAEADLVILDRTFSSISLVPNILYGATVQKLYDYMIDNYRVGCKEMLDNPSKKVILYDPNDTVVPFLASAQFGVSVELANLFFNKSNRMDVEFSSATTKNWTISKRLENAKFQSSLHVKQTKLVGFSKLLLNGRDMRVLYLSIGRVIRTCFAKDELGKTRQQPVADNLQAVISLPEFNMDNIPSEPNADEGIDEDALNNIHAMGHMKGPDKRLDDPKFDYSNKLASQVELDTAFDIIQNVGDFRLCRFFMHSP